jgi:hypothetical protein
MTGEADRMKNKKHKLLFIFDPLKALRLQIIMDTKNIAVPRFVSLTKSR